jgi:hypothetical protein
VEGEASALTNVQVKPALAAAAGRAGRARPNLGSHPLPWLARPAALLTDLARALEHQLLLNNLFGYHRSVELIPTR